MELETLYFIYSDVILIIWIIVFSSLKIYGLIKNSRVNIRMHGMYYLHCTSRNPHPNTRDAMQSLKNRLQKRPNHSVCVGCVGNEVPQAPELLKITFTESTNNAQQIKKKTLTYCLKLIQNDHGHLIVNLYLTMWNITGLGYQTLSAKPIFL